MKKIGTLAFLAASLLASHIVLANPLPPPTGGTSSGDATSTRSIPIQPSAGGTSGSGGLSITGDSGGSTAISGIGGAGGSSSQNDSGSDSGCSLVGSRLARRLAPWSIAGAFFVAYFFVRRRTRR